MTSSGWREMALGDVADIRVSNVDKRSVSGELPVRLCNYLDVYQQPYLAEDRPYMAATATAAELERFGLMAGDVLITKDSETPDDIAIPAVLDRSLPDLVCGYHLAILRPGPCVDPTWLAKQLGGHAAKRYFGSVATGSTRYGLSHAAIARLPIGLPPIEEQVRAAGILRTLDEALRKTEQLIAKLTQVKLGLLHDLISRGVGEDGDIRDPVRHPQHFVASPCGLTPASWRHGTLADFIDGSPQNGLYKPARFYADDGTPIVRIDSFYDGFVDDVSQLRRLRLSEREREFYRVEAGDLLINRVNSIEYVGKAGLYEGMETAVFESNIMRLRVCRGALLPDFAILVLCSPRCRAYFQSRAKPAVAQVSVNQNDVRELPIAVPSLAEQATIVARARAVAHGIESEEATLSKLRLLKYGLLEDLLSGRVRVSASETAA